MLLNRAGWAAVDTSTPDDAFERWRNALLDLLQDPASIMGWQDRRYRFAYEVGQLLIGPARPGDAPLTGPVLLVIRALRERREGSPLRLPDGLFHGLGCSRAICAREQPRS